MLHNLSTDTTVQVAEPLRKSTRVSKPPAYMSSYKCNNVFKESDIDKYHTQYWSNVVTLSPPDFNASICELVEPQ